MTYLPLLSDDEMGTAGEAGVVMMNEVRGGPDDRSLTLLSALSRGSRATAR